LLNQSVEAEFSIEQILSYDPRAFCCLTKALKLIRPLSGLSATTYMLSVIE